MAGLVTSQVTESAPIQKSQGFWVLKKNMEKGQTPTSLLYRYSTSTLNSTRNPNPNPTSLSPTLSLCRYLFFLFFLFLLAIFLSCSSFSRLGSRIPFNAPGSFGFFRSSTRFDMHLTVCGYVCTQTVYLVSFGLSVMIECLIPFCILSLFEERVGFEGDGIVY